MNRRQNRISGSLLAICALLLSLSCRTTPCAQATVQIPGEQLFESHCSRCHESGVQGAPMKSLLHQMTPNAVYNTLTRGAMKFQASDIPDPELRQIVFYITGREPADNAQQSLLACTVKLHLKKDDDSRVSAGWGVDAANRRFVDRKRAGICRWPTSAG